MDVLFAKQIKDLESIQELKVIRGGLIDTINAQIAKKYKTIYKRQLEMYGLIELDNHRRQK